MKIKGVIEDLKLIIVKIFEFLWSCCRFGLYFSRSIGPFHIVGANYRVLICCTCHFQSGSLCLFWLLLFAGLFSVYFPPWHKGAVVVTHLGSLVQLCCGEGGTLHTNITGVCGERSQCLSRTGLAPDYDICAFTVYTSQAPCCSARNCLEASLGYLHFPGLSCSSSGSWVLPKGADSVGPVFCALPKSEQLRWPGAWRAQSLPGEGCVLSPSPFQWLGFLGVQEAHLLRCAVSLFWGADLWLQPSWRMSTLQNPKKSWLATEPFCSLVEDASLGSPLPLSGSGCPPAACLQQGMGLSSVC